MRRDRGPVVFSVQPALPPETSASTPGPVYARRYTHTHTFTEGRVHDHVTTLTRAGVPGAAGGPKILCNGETLCGDLGQQVASINKTLACLKAKCEKHKQDGFSSPHYRLPTCADTAALRAQVSSSLVEQMDFYHRCMAIWVGLGQENQKRYVHAMFVAMQRWTQWTNEEQETFLVLFAEATSESR